MTQSSASPPSPSSRARDLSARVYHAPDGDAPAAPAPLLARQRATAMALHAEDTELARVRGLLADLRPDAGDPWVLPTPEAPTVPEVHVRDPLAAWGSIPRALLGSPPAPAGVTAAEVLRRLAGLPRDAAAVLLWLRARGTLEAGLRGLYADAGMAFASEAQTAAWEDLGARREGAPAWGRRLVLRAAEAWEAA